MPLKRFLLPCALFLFSPLLFLRAQTGVGGVWLVHTVRADGTNQDSFLNLTQEGNKVTGFVIQNYRQIRITKGSFTDGKLQLEINPWRRSILSYQGVLTDDRLKLKISRKNPSGEQSQDTEATAVRSSIEATRPPAPLPVPQLHQVADNGLVRTPPMGWNSWNHFANRVDDATVRASADAIAASGMEAAGYIYVNIDDTWEAGRDAQGNIQTNKKFPDMKALADYVHSKGLKIGIYSSPGPTTCAGYEGSFGHEVQDAKSYANWGIDYLKYDWCSAGQVYKQSDIRAVYQKMGDALAASGRPIVFSLCQYGLEDVWNWGTKTGGNLWRTTGDIGDRWDSMEAIAFKQADIAKYVAPGHWNDPDMLEVGNGGMTGDEYRVHMTLWALLSAPLLAGNDLQKMSHETLEILTNPDVIAIDQDVAAKPVKRTVGEGKTEIWIREMQDGAIVVALLNRDETAKPVTIAWSKVDLTAPAKAKNLWTHEDVTLSGDSYTATVQRHGVVLLRVPKS